MFLRELFALILLFLLQDEPLRDFQQIPPRGRPGPRVLRVRMSPEARHARGRGR